MSNSAASVRIAILDDYQNVALSMADWSGLDKRATITVFNDHLADPDAVVARLQSFDIVCVMRERTPMTRAIIERLPRLRLIASTALRNASIDLEAAAERSVTVVHTGYSSTPTIELTWALILAGARNLVMENASLRAGGWQRFVGDDLAGRTLGVLGLGNVGGAVARIGKAFGMEVIAWSPNLTAERAAEAGAVLVTKQELFRQADILTIHLVLSGRMRGLVGAKELALMQPTARLVNTSRGPIVVEADLSAALQSGQIAGAAVDVFDQEPLPLDHPFRSLPNLLTTPHIGHTDTDHTTCLHLPSIGLVIAGDAIYNGAHPYLVESNRQGLRDWLAAIDKIEALNPRVVVVGHGPMEPDNAPRHIQETRHYIQDFIRLDDETRTAQELYDGMLALHPDRINPGSLWGSANAAKAFRHATS
jgi:phosphoglycerate dehydrogenase-like enzyme